MNIFFFRVLLCTLAMHLLGFTTEEVLSNTIEAPPTATCACAAFKDKDGTGEPILSKTITDISSFNITCTDEGKKDCKEMCINLATLAKERVINLLCEKLPGTVNSLKPAAFYKICNDPWTYAEFSAMEPICCKEHAVVTCKA